MNLNETADFLEIVEQRCSVDDWKIDGICIWPLVRINLKDKAYISENSEILIENQWRRRFEIVKKAFIDNLKILVCDSQHNQSVKSSDVVFLGYAVNRNVLMPDKTLLDHNLDPIKMCLENKGITTFSFEEIGDNELRLPRWSNSYIVDKQLLRRRICNKFFKRKYKKVICQVQGYDEFLQILKSENINTSGLSLNELIETINNIQSLADMFLVWLDKIKPKLVIYTNWQSSTRMAISLAAHKKNIPVLEIQHGVAASGGKNNITYCNWLKIPKGGYELAPDYMWVWDTSDYEAMISWANESWKPFVGGHPMNLIWTDSNNKMTEHYQKRYSELYENDKPVILFTLQWGVSYPDWIIDYINQHEEYTWIIRRHPISDECIERFISKMEQKDNIKINSSDCFPLEVLLMNIDVHITMYSSVVIDAESFSCPSIVLHPEARNFFSKQIDDGKVYFVDDNMMLNGKIKELISDIGKKNNCQDFAKMHDVGCKALNNIMSIIAENGCAWE